MKDIYNRASALQLLAQIEADIEANTDHRVKEVGDRVKVWDGSGNVDKHTKAQRYGIDPLFETTAIVIETGCKVMAIDEHTELASQELS